jgi:hypothetical protein
MLLAHPDADAITLRLADCLAHHLAALGRGDAALVVVLDPEHQVPIGRRVIGPALPEDADGIAGLVVPSTPSVVEVSRVHDPDLRDVAGRWQAHRLLLVPCTFGHDLLALAVVPLADGCQPDRRAAAAYAERFGAAATRARLFGPTLVAC